MPISHTHRFIYIHVPKCAGASVIKALAAAGTNLELHGEASADERIRFKQTHLQHATAEVLRGQLTPDTWNSYFKFSIVRNPWDWLVSLYHFHYRKTLSTTNTSVLSGAATNEKIQRFQSWATAICRIAMNRPKRGATYYLTGGEGEIIVDYVARYENLAVEFSKICSQVGISAVLPHINSSKHVHYRDYYDAALAGLVATTYERDIESFGYSF
jgi:hypothetical protein